MKTTWFLIVHLLVITITLTLGWGQAAAQDEPQPLGLQAVQKSFHRLGPDQLSFSAELIVDDAATLSLEMTTSLQGLQSWIETPDGERIDPQTVAALGGDYLTWDGDEEVGALTFLPYPSTGFHYLYTLPSQGPGIYRLHASARPGLNRDAAAIVSLLQESEVVAALLVGEPMLVLDDVAVLTAAVYDFPEPVTGATVSTTVFPQAGAPVVVALHDDGAEGDAAANDGLYSGEYKPNAPGGYVASGEVRGQTLSGLPFRRTVSAYFQVSARAGSLAGALTDHGEDDNGNGLFERLVVEVGTEIGVAGRYAVAVRLRASNGRQLKGSSYRDLTLGAQTIPVAFEAEALRGLGVDGPLAVTAVEMIFFSDEGAQTMARRTEAGATQAYAQAQWERPAFAVTGVTGDQASDANSNSLYDLLSVSVGIVVPGAGQYEWTAALVDGRGREVSLAAGTANLAAGSTTLALEFPGTDIGQSGADGPYRLAQLSIFSLNDPTGGISVDNAGVTQPYQYTNFEGGVATATVPDLAGLAKAAAATALRSANLTVGISDTTPSAVVAIGQIVTQSVPPGAVVGQGYVVDFTVSSGPVRVPMPDVQGLSEANAERVLAVHGLSVGSVVEANSAEPLHMVLSQSPAPGVLLNQGSVNLTVSRATHVTMRNLVGKTEEDARLYVAGDGFRQPNVTTQFDPNAPYGVVSAQQPISGAVVTTNTQVLLTVSLGEPIVVPNLVGLAQMQASHTITSGKLSLGSVSFAPSGSAPAGTVLAQSPVSGTVTPAFTFVELTISLGSVLLGTTPDVHSLAPVETEVALQLFKSLQPDSVTPESYRVHGSQSGGVTGALSVQGNMIHLTPARPLQPGEQVEVTATGDLRYEDGEATGFATVWRFWAAPRRRSSGTYVDSGQRIEYKDGLELGFGMNHSALGDLDGDGDLDALMVGSDLPSAEVGDAMVMRNEGGAFIDTGQRITLTMRAGYDNTEHVALGDLDGDGDLDAFVANYNSIDAGAPNKVLFNDGNGVLTDSGQLLGVELSNSERVLLGDLDGDGGLDAFVDMVIRQAHGSIVMDLTPGVWQNDGSGVFTQTQVLEDTGSWASWEMGDVDGDGDLDLFQVIQSEPSRVWLNNGSGRFADSGQRLGPDNSGADVALGDLDGDSDLDAFVTNFGSQSRVWLNQGGAQGGTQGLFAASGQELGGADDLGVNLIDVDGDGDLDALTMGTRTANGPVTVLTNNGAAQFSRAAPFLLGVEVTHLAPGDVNGDGTIDLLIGQWNPSRYVTVWLNDPQANGYNIFLPVVERN